MISCIICVGVCACLVTSSRLCIFYVGLLTQVYMMETVSCERKILNIIKPFLMVKGAEGLTEERNYFR